IAVSPRFFVAGGSEAAPEPEPESVAGGSVGSELSVGSAASAVVPREAVRASAVAAEMVSDSARVRMMLPRRSVTSAMLPEL
ncbi:hypothetical protein DN546_37185, partial [Burkholderia multivorans]